VAKCNYLETTVTNQNFIHEEMKSRLNSGNVCYHFVQSVMSFFFIYKNIKIKICRTKILSLVLYGCETWSLTLRDKHRLRVLENRVLKRIFGLKREEVAGGWKRLHNEEFHNLYASPNIIRRMESAGHVARKGEMRNTYGTLVGNPEGKRPLRRPRHTWENNIRMYFREMGWKGVDWMHLAQDRDKL
jgi:hypothetical protein